MKKSKKSFAAICLAFVVFISFTCVMLPKVKAVADSFEPDNSFTQYSAMTVTTSLQSQSRTIDPAGDNDYIRFYVGSSNYGIYTFYSQGYTDTYGYLYNPGQTQLASDDDSGGSLQFRIQYMISSAGYYFLRVRGYSSSVVGPYTLCFSYAPSSLPPSSGDSYEPDNSFSQYSSMTPTTSLQSQSRSINPAGDNDYIRFQASAGTYTFYTSSSIDTYGHLYDSNQNQLASDDDSGGSLQFRIVYAITASGYYFLRVRGYSSGTTGAYTLYFSYQPNTPPSGDTFEPDNSFTQYSAMTVTTSLQSQSRSVEPAGDNDYIRFQASLGTYTFYTSSSIDTYGHLYDSNQNQLASDDDSGGNLQFRIVYTFSSSGYYFLRVRGYSSSSTHGPYTLYYSYVPQSILPPLGSHFLTIQNPAISSDGKTLYFELHWHFLVIPYEEHTYLPFSDCAMTVTGPQDSHLQTFEPVADQSAWSQDSTEMAGVLMDLAGEIPGTNIGPVSVFSILSLAQHAYNIQQAFQYTREHNRPASAFHETMGGAAFFTEIVYVVQIKSDVYMNSWQVHLQASAVHMIGPNVQGEALTQDETVNITGTT
jgi:hypothetical protein